MKCDELKKRHYSEMDSSNPDDEMYYPANKVDAAIAELKAANKLLKEHIANGDVSRITWIDEVIELKQKLESVQASMCCDVVDANMDNRRLQRALYKVCANWAHFAVAFFANYATKERWRKMENKCLKKAEVYK